MQRWRVHDRCVAWLLNSQRVRHNVCGVVLSPGLFSQPKGIAMWGYVFALTNGEPVVVICRDELDVERSIARRGFDNDDDFAAFWGSLSYVRPLAMV